MQWTGTLFFSSECHAEFYVFLPGTEGSSVGLITAPPVDKDNFTVGEFDVWPDDVKLDSYLSFTITLADGVSVPWECRLKDNKLFVEVATNLPVYGSKDRWVWC